MNKTAVAVASVLGVGVIGYLAWKKFGKKKSTDTSEGGEKKSAETKANMVEEETSTTEEDFGFDIIGIQKSAPIKKTNLRGLGKAIKDAQKLEGTPIAMGSSEVPPPPTPEDAQNEVDIDAEETADAAQAALDKKEREEDANITDAKEEDNKKIRAIRRKERKAMRMSRRALRLTKRMERRAMGLKDKIKSLKKREQKAKEILVKLPLTKLMKAETQLANKTIKKAKSIAKKLGGIFRRKKRNFAFGEEYLGFGEEYLGYGEEYFFSFDDSQTFTNFSSEDADFAFNGLNF
jgi:hypothetical protein